MLAPLKLLFGYYDNPIFSWKVWVPLFAIVVLISGIHGIIRAQAGKRKILFLQYGPFFCGSLGVLSLTLFVIIFLYSPDKPGVFCSMRFDMEGFIALYEEGQLVHTRDFNGPARPLDFTSNSRRSLGDRVSNTYGVLSEIEPNPYVHYVNPLLTLLLLFGTVGWVMIGAVWFVVNRFTIYKAPLPEPVHLSQEELKIENALQEAIDGEHDPQTKC